MKKLNKKIISATVLLTLLIYTMPILAFTNEETVYSKLDSNGKKYKTIVSTFLNEDEIVQNEVQKDLPVDCKVKYELDGKEISSEELAGKNGNVKITLEYINKLENEVDINGKNETLYTPFFVISGTIIDNENNKNIKISNGKLINDGSKTIVMGIAMPGIQESLNISKEEVEIPSKIEITMDSTNFEMGNIMSYCTPKILENGEIDDILEKTDELFEKVNDLQDATNKIEDGAIRLNDGVVVLNDGAKKLNSGANELSDGVGTLKSGTSKLTTGANSLKNGATEYTSKSKEFNGAVNSLTGAIGTMNSSYDAINGGLASLNANAPTLSAGANSVSSGAQDLYNGLNALNSTLNGIPVTKSTSNTVSVTPNNSDKISKIQGITSNNEDLLDTLNANNEALKIVASTLTDENAKASIESQIAANTATIAALRGNDAELNGVATSLNEPITYTANNTSANTDVMNTIKGTIGVLTEGAKKVSDGASAVAKGAGDAQSAISALSAGSSNFKGALDQLNSSSSQLLSANNKLTEAAGTIASGANELANGAISLDQGANKLSDGTNSLKNGTNDLESGINTLLNGSNELVDGIKKFNNEGIKEINNYVNKDLKNTVTRIEKLENLSADFNKFGSEEQREAIKFINILDSIKTSAKEEKEEDIMLTTGEKEEKEK